MTPPREILAMLTARDRALALGVAVLAGAVAAVTQGVAFGPGIAILAALSVAVWVIDRRHFLIPDLVNLPLAAAGLGDSALTGADLAGRLITMAALALVLWVLRWAISAWKGRTALGLGDLKLLVAAAAWLPMELLAPYVFLASASGLVWMLAQRPRVERLAFGAHLAPWLCLLVLARPWIG